MPFIYFSLLVLNVLKLGFFQQGHILIAAHTYCNVYYLKMLFDNTDSYMGSGSLTWYYRHSRIYNENLLTFNIVCNVPNEKAWYVFIFPDWNTHWLYPRIPCVLISSPLLNIHKSSHIVFHLAIYPTKSGAGGEGGLEGLQLPCRWILTSLSRKIIPIIVVNGK